MTRKTYVFQTNPDGSYEQPLHMVEKHLQAYPFRGHAKHFSDARHHVIGDIEPYKSTIDGSVITSRNKHRKHLRDHGCVEIGTENMQAAQKHFKKPGHRGDVTADVVKAFHKAG